MKCYKISLRSTDCWREIAITLIDLVGPNVSECSRLVTTVNFRFAHNPDDPAEAQPWLRRNSLNDGVCGGSRDDPTQLPACGRKQFAKLLCCALAASRKNQHLQIEEFARREVVTGLNDVVNDDKLTARIDAFSAGRKYLDAEIIRPVVNDVFHDVSVGPCRDRRKHIAGHQRATLYHARERPVPASVHNVRHFVKRASKMRIPRQDCRQQKSVPAANIYDGMNAVKTVGCGDSGAINHGKRSHGVMEDLPFLGILPQILENVRSVDLVKRLLTGSHAVFQSRPSATVPLPAAHDRKRPQAGIGVAAQNRRHGHFRKRSLRSLRQNSHTGGGPHETVQGLWVGPALAREFLGRSGASLEQVGNSELGEAGDGTRHVGAIH
jgi:hypothetical protein